jgi:cytidine deaminase
VIPWPGLREAAALAAKTAYCPYSGFHVGAAVLSGGELFSGGNIENASYGLTVCAERVAIWRAIAAGHRTIDALVVTCPDAAADSDAAVRMPCGACRQVLAEFGGPDVPILVEGVGQFTLRDMLPSPFALEGHVPATEPSRSVR